MPRIFFSRSDSNCKFPGALAYFQEAALRLFPDARPAEFPDPSLKSSHSFVFRQGENLFWFEVASETFTRDEIPDFLGKARRLEAAFPGKADVLLAAPRYEEGVRELLGFVRVPIQIFRFGFGESDSETALWLEELTPASSLPPSSFRRPHPDGEIPPAISPEPSGASVAQELSWSRLSREELREFIQLEIDAASYK